MKRVIDVFFLALFLILPTALSNNFDSKCTKKFCEDYKDSGKCRALSAVCRNEPDSTRFLHPDTCNCCEYCVKNLEEGETCVVGQPGSPTPLAMCGPGLQCISSVENNATCQMINSACTKAQKEFDQRKEEGSLGMTEVRPRCDVDGYYDPVHCIPGSICYCLSPMGDRIFGELPYLNYEDEKKMTCGCSVTAWRAQTSLDPQHKETMNVARCTEIGTFDQLQCMTGSEAACLCVDPESGSPNPNIDLVREEDLDENNPPCFDITRHTVGKYSSECEDDFEYYLNEKDERDDEEELSLLEMCQPDGKFSRVQTSGSKKVCVDPNGRQIDSYEAEKSQTEAQNMNCNCARTHWLLKNAGVVELPSCCANGNFKAWQCRRSQCFCVDGNGDQVGAEVSANDLSKLECYKKTEGKPC